MTARETATSSRDETTPADNHPPEPQKSVPAISRRQKPASLIECGGCGNGWTGLSACHCSGCHRTFTGLSAFDIHRVGGQCGNPESIVGKDGEPRLIRVDRPRWSGWRIPGEMPEDLW